MALEEAVQTDNAPLDDKINEWLAWNRDPEAAKEVRNLVSDGDVKTLSNLFLKRMDFGTAGLRGRMGPGYSQMNDLVIVQTGQGLLEYLTESVLDLANKGIVIGYDGRYNSKRFAELTAAIFINRGVRVYVYSKVCPTPFVPFGVSRYKCAAGIMITASHNPKEDNGYKVYWENGAQIISPHDKGIQKCILENLEPRESSWEVENINESPLCEDPLDDVMKSYYPIIKDGTLYPEVNQNTILKFTYTAMHGVGYDYMVAAFDTANFKNVDKCSSLMSGFADFYILLDILLDVFTGSKISGKTVDVLLDGVLGTVDSVEEPFVVVEEQRDPDPEFPTVKFPNPEEGKSALDLSIKTAEANGSTIILANDPDADRLACAVKNRKDEWHVFTGNELGGLLGWWMLHAHRVRRPDADIADACMLASTVSSKILSSMAKKEGFQFEETLTGFKWMGNRSVELMKTGKSVLFAFEEAIGFMCGSSVLDKDGISAGVRVAEMAAYLETMGLTLIDKLEEIYTDYGRHISENSYWICHESETIKSIFERLRNFDGAPNTYPADILGGKYVISGVRDLTSGYDNTKPGNKAVLPVSKSSQMITFTFDNGLVTTLRTSGTEPKIKYYSELCASPEQQDLEVLRALLREMVSAIVAEFLEPEKNALIARSS